MEGALQRYKLVFRDADGNAASVCTKQFPTDDLAFRFARNTLPCYASVEVSAGDVRLAFLHAQTHFGRRRPIRSGAKRHEQQAEPSAWRRWLGLA